MDVITDNDYYCIQSIVCLCLSIIFFNCKYSFVYYIQHIEKKTIFPSTKLCLPSFFLDCI